jgi:very-long-chain enoyl-CoA reductase
MDILLSAARIVKSNTAVTAMQTGAKLVVAYYGKPDYMKYLGLVWAFSDLVRYVYHLVPNMQFVKILRYSQYKLLYPIGVGLELMTILPAIDNSYAKFAVFGLYIAIFPHMYNHTSKMETNQYILSIINKYRSVSVDTDKFIVYGKNRYVFTDETLSVVKAKLSGSRYNWKPHTSEANTWVLKDYGLQISWRLVYVIEYWGAFILFPIMVQDGARLDVILWSIHYGKRIYESMFVHSFSSDTMPIANLFKNSAYYWGAAALLGYNAQFEMITMNAHNTFIVLLWSLCQIGNGFCHYYLANLRSDPTSREHILPTNILFQIVTCPNYTYEILGWALFACLGYNGLTTYFGVKVLFCMIGAGQMYQWARGKKRRYKKLFGDKYKVSGVLLPGI